jgi:hypothetical protein
MQFSSWVSPLRQISLMQFSSWVSPRRQISLMQFSSWVSPPRQISLQFSSWVSPTRHRKNPILNHFQCHSIDLRLRKFVSSTIQFPSTIFPSSWKQRAIRLEKTF